MPIRRRALIVALLLSLSNSSTLAQTPDFETCSNDGDCQKGYFCTGKFGNRVCDRCVDCPSRYNRLASTRTDCSKSSFECGECLPGFQEETLTMGRKRDHCRPVKKAPSAAGNDSFSGGVIAVIALAVAVVVVIVGLWVACWMRLKVRAENARPSATDPETPSNASPPSYAQAIGEHQPLIVDSATGHRAFDDRPEPQSTRAERSTLILHVTEEAAQTKNDATPFNLRGYRAHLPVSPDSSPVDEESPLHFEGAIELELFHIDRSPSPTESVLSNATEPSHWQPEDHAGLIEPDLDVIPEEESAEDELPLAQEDGDDLPQADEADERRSHHLASDSGILTTLSGRNSHSTLSDAPDAFAFNDSGLNLTEVNEQATVRSLGTPGTPIQTRSSVIRAFSSVDVLFLQDLRYAEREEEVDAQSTSEVDATKSSRKRRHQEDADSDEQRGPALKHTSL